MSGVVASENHGDVSVAVRGSPASRNEWRLTLCTRSALYWWQLLTMEEKKCLSVDWCTFNINKKVTGIPIILAKEKG